MYKHFILFGEDNKESVQRYITDDNAVQLIANAMHRGKDGSIKFDIFGGEIQIETFNEDGVLYSRHYLEKITNVRRHIMRAEREKKYDVGILANEIKVYEFDFKFAIHSIDQITLSDEIKYVIQLIDPTTGEVISVPEEHIWNFSHHLEED